MTYTPNIGRRKMLRADALGLRRIDKPRRGHTECLHDLCAAERTIAASPCTHCGEAIGFGTPFVTTDAPAPFHSDTYTHASCVLPEGSQFKPKVQTSGRTRRNSWPK